jgi:hypothetical protein
MGAGKIKNALSDFLKSKNVWNQKKQYKI